MNCKAHMDGDCDYPLCPQLADNEPEETGRHCPWDLADGPFTGKRHQQPETPSYASIVDPALREAIKVTLRSRLVCAGTFDTNTEGLADALMPVITAAVTAAQREAWAQGWTTAANPSP